MTEEETYGGPRYVPQIDGERGMIVTEEAARALAEPGFPIKKASVFFRNLAIGGYVHPYSRQRSGKRAYYYKPDQVVIAAILHRMGQAGLNGEEQRRAASQALSSANLDAMGMTPGDMETAPPGALMPPAMKVLLGYLQGQRNFCFELATQRDTKRGDVLHTARVRQAGNPEATFGSMFIIQPGSVIDSVYAVDLDPVLAHLTRPREALN